MSALKTFFGLSSDGASGELVAKGKRRVVTYLAFLSWVFIVASIDAPDWVTGYIEFDTYSAEKPPTLSLAEFCSDLGAPLPEPIEGVPLLGATLQRSFHLGLTQYTRGGTTQMRASGQVVPQTCVLDIKDQLNNLNAAISQSSSNSSSWLYGLNQIPIATFSSTIGLLAFAAVLQGAAWLSMAAVQYEIALPFEPVQKHAVLIIRVLMSTAAFFTMLGFAVFAGAPVKTEFCKIFEPDADFLGQGCGYGTGFDLSVVAFVFALLQVALAWLWMPADTGIGGRYEFAGKSGDGAAASSTTGLSSSAYQDITGSA